MTPLNVFVPSKIKYILAKFQNITQSVKNKLLIPNKEGWYYIVIRNLPELLRGITSKNNGDEYCLNCLHSFRTKNKLESCIKVCKNKAFCNVVMPSRDTRKLKFNQCLKSNKVPFIVYADLEKHHLFFMLTLNL